jgi:hypothetical protein
MITASPGSALFGLYLGNHQPFAGGGRFSNSDVSCLTFAF